MPALLLYGNYTPDAWKSIKADPGVAPSAIEAAAAALGFRLAGFWFAFDEFDFYSIVEGGDLAALSALRHQLMSNATFRSLFGEVCFAPDEMISAFKGILARQVQPA
jgi:uncharacterized protein with GYD domain